MAAVDATELTLAMLAGADDAYVVAVGVSGRSLG